MPTKPSQLEQALHNDGEQKESTKRSGRPAIALYYQNRTKNVEIPDGIIIASEKKAKGQERNYIYLPDSY